VYNNILIHGPAERNQRTTPACVRSDCFVKIQRNSP